MASAHAVSNKEQFDRYRRTVEADLKRPARLIDIGGVGAMHMQLVGAWMARYSRRLHIIEGTRGWADPFADTAAVDALVARNVAKDAEWPQLPDWDKETWFFVDHALKNSQRDQLDVSSASETCKFGPSLRRLWGEAKARGATDEEAWRAIYDWGLHRPAAWKRDDAKKRRKPSPQDAPLAQWTELPLTWSKTADVDFPWSTDRAGARCQVQINDFPDDHMYTLFVDGTSVGDFDDWPDAWDRGDRRPAAAVRPAPAIAITVKGRFLERYQAGEYEAVWAELVSLGPAVRDPQYFPEATAVARETMRRARHNVELLIQRLDGMGYEFWDAKQSRGKAVDHLKDKDVFIPPARDEKRQLDEWERRGVILPLSLRMWMEEVGRVDLTGSHPALSFLEHEDNFPGIYADPLMVIPNADSIEDMMGLAGDKETDLFISHDARDKAAVGMNELLDSAYWMEAPNPAADGWLKGYQNEITFVDYLRLSFRWGGFPGWKDQTKRPEGDIAALTDGLLPL